MEVNIMNIIISIVGILVGGGVAYSFISHFIKLSKEKQLDNIREWLVYACLEAEKMLGGKTGKVKLRYVYDLFISKYKFISAILPFETFSILVDEALEQMRKLIDTNDAIKKYVIEEDK